LDKIQQVNINQSFIQRLINVYDINVDTAGSAEKPQIKAITHSLALALKEDFRKQMEVATNEGISNVEQYKKKAVEDSFISISFSSLLKVGLHQIM
jgi:putative membrane protein